MKKNKDKVRCFNTRFFFLISLHYNINVYNFFTRLFKQV